MTDVKPVNQQSFMAAFLSEHDGAWARDAYYEWMTLHTRVVLSDEIDEDPS